MAGLARAFGFTSNKVCQLTTVAGIASVGWEGFRLASLGPNRAP